MQNYIDGEWRRLDRDRERRGHQPGDAAKSSAARRCRPPRTSTRPRTPRRRAFAGWRRVPVTERVQYLFRLKALLEEHFEDLARTITMECGKTLAESRGEMRRGIENVEVAVRHADPDAGLQLRGHRRRASTR